MPPIPNINELSLEQKVGQVVCFGWSGEAPLTVNDHARALVEKMLVGSVVLMGRNVDDPIQTRAMLADLQALSPIPLLVAVDQEGGSVNRFKHTLHQFAGNMALGAIAVADPELGVELTRAQAAAQAAELRDIGIHWNFAPVADVNNNPDNPIIGVRSYGESPEMVAWLASNAVDGFQENGVLACAKHFPGHGDTNIDSHLALPTVHGDWDRINSVELPPFRSVIEAGVGSIMTTHILFPSLDGAAPATVSAPLLTGLLRNRMEFTGLVITDCLEMDAIGKTMGTAQGAVNALKAGADVALVCHTPATQQETIDCILNAVDYGELPERRLDEAVARVLAAKGRYITDTGRVGEAWNAPEHGELERKIAQAAVTVVRNAGGIPAILDRPVLVVSAHSAGTALAQALESLGVKVETLALEPHLPDGETAEQLSSAAARSQEFGTVIAATAPREPWSERPMDVERQAVAVRRLHSDFGHRLIAVALKEPYDIRRYPEVSNYLVGYGYSPAVISAIASVLAGQSPPSGKLPISIPGITQ